MHRIALITGASGGIGSAIAYALSRAGFCCVLGYSSSPAEAKSTAEKINDEGGAAFTCKLDVTSTGDIAESVKYCLSLGALQVLVNCAGISDIRQIQDVTAENADLLWSVNLRGPILLCSEVSKAMIKQKSGRIINISSMWGVTGASCESVYSATKGGLIAFTKSLAKELGPSGISVNCIAPGVVNTKMNSHLSQDDLSCLAGDTPLGRIGEPDDIAEAVKFLCDSSFITGQCITVDGGFTL